ncbi:MAG: restriction endonuclease subunit S, partial [Acidobacteria bacterium]|nr:restriction endonuclease subunit S [Acidobacteriota bacterium]
HRIVAKVDELMALCDRLEAAQAERERRRDRVALALSQRLNLSSDVSPLRETGRSYSDQLERVSAEPKHINEVRRVIVVLALRGQLVARSNSDIETSRRRAISNGKLRQTGVPPDWDIAPLHEVAESIVDCPHSTPKWTTSGRMCVRTNQFNPGRLNLSDARFVSESTYSERIVRLRPMADDILYSREGGILGIACRIPPNLELCLGQRMMLIRPGKATAPAFLELVLNSPLITEIARTETTGGAAPRVNVATVKGYPIPLPPLDEQHRIVARVDELLALCDRLEAQLTNAQTESSRLLEAVLHKALEEPSHQPASLG